MKTGEDGCDPKAAPRLRGAADEDLRQRLEGDVGRALRAKELAEADNVWDVPVLEEDVPKAVRAAYGHLLFHTMQARESCRQAEEALMAAKLLLKPVRVQVVRRSLRLGGTAVGEALAAIMTKKS
jgi:hypothetical protein